MISAIFVFDMSGATFEYVRRTEAEVLEALSQAAGVENFMRFMCVIGGEPVPRQWRITAAERDRALKRQIFYYQETNSDGIDKGTGHYYPEHLWASRAHPSDDVVESCRSHAGLGWIALPSRSADNQPKKPYSRAALRSNSVTSHWTTFCLPSSLSKSRTTRSSWGGCCLSTMLSSSSSDLAAKKNVMLVCFSGSRTNLLRS